MSRIFFECRTLRISVRTESVRGGGVVAMAINNHEDILMV
jgi:hypothetical protein